MHGCLFCLLVALKPHPVLILTLLSPASLPCSAQGGLIEWSSSGLPYETLVDDDEDGKAPPSKQGTTKQRKAEAKEGMLAGLLSGR